MSIATIHRGDGETVTVDLGPVEDFVNRLRDGSLPVADEVEVPASMDREQLRFRRPPPYGLRSLTLFLAKGPSVQESRVRIAVGMPVARHPPHRSQRAGLPHWALASSQTRKRANG